MTETITHGDTATETAHSTFVSLKAGGETNPSRRARTHARIPHFPGVAPLLRTLFTSNRKSPWVGITPRLQARMRYARYGPWCSSDSKKLRAAGIAYCVVIACPGAFLADLIDWITERPSRLACTALLMWVMAGSL